MRRVKTILKMTLLVMGVLALAYFITFFIRKFNVVKGKTVLNTSHFKITYKGILKSAAESISQSLEENYDRIRSELKDPEHGLINVFVHSTQQDFNSATSLIDSKANGTSRGQRHFI